MPIADDILAAAILRLDLISEAALDALRKSLGGRSLRDALIQDGLLTPTELSEAELSASIRKPTSDEVGTRFGRYRVEREIGRGSYATVYLADDTELHRPVALKIFSGFMDIESESMARFRHEARMSARLNHPGIAAVYETAVEKGFPYIAMEYIAGKTLGDLIKEGKPPRRSDRVRLIRDVARSVQAAHEQGVIHRDLKPSNVLVDDAGKPHVVDFGLAKDAAVFASLTATGATVGTPAYMSPEQARGDAKIDARADVYALGVLLYEMLALRRAFAGDTIAGVLRKVLDEEPEPLRRAVPGIERDLEIICNRAMAKVPAERYPSAADFADDLDRHLAGEPVQARPASVVYRITKSVKRHRTAWSAGFAVALVAVVAFVSWLLIVQGQQRALDVGRARELLQAAQVHAERGSYASAWAVLRDIELRYRHTPVMPEAYRAMIELVRAEGGRDHVPVQEPILRRLIESAPGRDHEAWAHYRLARIYESCQRWSSARDHYRLASGEDAAVGAEWAALAARQARSGIGADLGATGDVDGDGRDEILAIDGANLVQIGWDGAKLVVERTWPSPAPGGVSLLLADFTRDGKPELVVFHDGATIYALPGLERLGGVSLGPQAGYRGAAGDLDGDGRPELALVRRWPHGRFYFIRFGDDWKPAVQDVEDLEPSESDARTAAMADLDGDGRLEAVFAAGEWSRYDVTVWRLDGGKLRRVARRQLGNNEGLACADIDGDGRAEIYTAKFESLPNVRLFEDDPTLGKGGPVALRLDGTRLVQTLLAGIEYGDHPRVFASASSALGPVVAVGSDREAAWDFFLRRGANVVHRRLAAWGPRRVWYGGAFADLDGDRRPELVLSGSEIVALGLGPEDPRTELGWLEIARDLKTRGLHQPAIDAYEAAAETAPGEAYAGQAACYAAMGERRKALERFHRAAAHGHETRESLQILLRTAESLGEWTAAQDAARKLGDGARVVALGRVLEMKPVFSQEFSEALDARWEIREPLAWFQRTDPAALRMQWMPGDAPLRLPFDWDGSSIRLRWWIRPRSMQYANQLEIVLRHRESGWSTAAQTDVYAGGGSVRFGALCRIDGAAESAGGGLEPVDWARFDAGAVLTLSYIQHLNQWDVTLVAADGTLLGWQQKRGAPAPPAGGYALDVQGRGSLLMATQVDLRRVEIDSLSGAVAVGQGAVDAAARAFCAGDYETAIREYDARRDPLDALRLAVALAKSGDIGRASAALADLKRSSSGSAGLRFEFQGRGATRWEASLVRFMHVDETLCWKVCAAADLIEPEEYGALLARAAYQQHVDSGQTGWREAVAMLRRAVDLAPKDPHAWYMLGFCRYKLGDVDAARAAMEKAHGLESAIERDYAKQGGPALFVARIAARQGKTAEVHGWLAKAKAAGGNLDIARHDRIIGPMFEDERFLREFGD